MLGSAEKKLYSLGVDYREGEPELCIVPVPPRRKSLFRADQFNLLILIAATAVALFLCCSYIRIRSSISSSVGAIAAQEQELEKLRRENDLREEDIRSATDLNHVYTIATKELGMVYPSRSQIISYDRGNHEYVWQNDNIP